MLLTINCSNELLYEQKELIDTIKLANERSDEQRERTDCLLQPVLRLIRQVISNENALTACKENPISNENALSVIRI